ncbi:porin family protein [Methylocystis sp. WRRC1]|uniref:outer membrane protein n=1 Tax=unclassified Methylocystis TaxID=2625913 RepID=UPI0001F88444|nr:MULTISPECIES: outer membrane protein [unclassified Methylocystis]MCC3246516.1 porin family protein [Methylocystis sp. WRRC1]
MTFKATVVGALASVLMIGAASAADLPSRKAPPEYIPPPPVFSWEGWHIGVVGGYGGGSSSTSSWIWDFGAVPAVWNVNTSRGTSGYLVGYESGYTWQFSNNFVLGYESEFSYADVRSNNTNSWFGGVSNRLEWFGAERLRFGYAFGRILPYVTGGLAYGRVKASGTDSIGGFLFPTNASTWQAGWTVGAGLEYAFWDKFSIKAEYLYTSMKGPSGTGLAFPNGFRTFDGRGFDTHLARVGLNYNVKSIGALLGWDGLGL